MIYETTDAKTIHEIMMKAYEETRQYPAHSSALDETVETIEQEFENGARGFIYEYKGEPVAAIRFKLDDDAIYFHRLSVLPEYRGKGYAKRLILHIEKYAHAYNLDKMRVKVRKEVQRNIDLYHSQGYTIVDENVTERDGVQIPVVTMEKAIPIPVR